jgi:hypothetical protein
MKAALLSAGLLCLHIIVQAQDPEFPKKEFIMHLRVHNGMVTSFKSSPDLYAGGVQLIPQFTVAENLMRAGIIAGGFYTGKKLQALIGPTVSFKLKTISLKNFGSGGNINLSIDHLWGTGKQRLFGGALNIDLLNFIVIGAGVQRDYHLNNWWLQGTFAFRISKVKKIPHP